MPLLADKMTNIAQDLGSSDAVPSQPTKMKSPRSASQQPEFWVETIHGVDALTAIRADWDELAANAIEQNPFYESWMLIEGVKCFGADVDLQFDLVWQRNPRPNQPPYLVGLFPFERRRSFGGVPIRLRKAWQHKYLYYCVPLVRRGVANEVLHALFDSMSQGAQRATGIELHHLDIGGPFAQALLEVTSDRAAATYTVESYNRALIRPANSFDAYVNSAMTNHNRKEVRRLARRLSEIGVPEVRVLTAEEDLEKWLNHFLQMEAAGWKGREATALASDDVSRNYFKSIAQAAYVRGQLMLVGLFLNQQPIALKCNFLAGEGSFAFKIAFDEQFSRFSPGVQLELENVRLLHQMPNTKWMDSCAAQHHFMIGRLWQERRTITKVIVSTGRRIDNLAVGLLSGLSFARKAFRRAPDRCANSKSKPQGTSHE